MRRRDPPKRAPLAVLAEPPRKKRDVRLMPLLALATITALWASIASPDWRLDGTPAPTKFSVDRRGRLIVIRDPQQVDASVYWFALDPAHGSYAATLATVAATAASVPAGYGTYAVTAGATGYTGLNIVGPVYGLSGLSISASGVCRDIFNYACSRNPNYAAATTRTNTWGESYTVWGQFIKAPARLPTTGEDRRLANAKGLGSDTALYLAQSSAGTGSGNSCANRKAIHGASTTGATIVIICGRVSRTLGDSDFSGVGVGSSGTPTLILAHPVLGGELMGGARLGSGNSIGGGQTDGVWVNDTGSRWKSVNTTGGGGGVPVDPAIFVMADAGGTGTIRQLTKVASAALVTTTTDSYFIDVINAGLTNVYCNIGGGNPTNATYWGGAFSGGISAAPQVNYVHYYGIVFYQTLWRWADALGDNGSYHSCYACKWLYCATSSAGIITVGIGGINEVTGAMTKIATQHDRLYLGCELGYAQAGFYDFGGASDVCSKNLTIRDTYIHHMGSENINGVDMTNASDAHGIASFGGWDGLTVDNVTIVEAGNPLVAYADTNNHNIPTGGLELTDGYTKGWPRAHCFPSTASPTQEAYNPPMKNIDIGYVYIHDPLSTAAYVAIEQYMIALSGDGDVYGYADQIKNIRIHHSRIETTTGTCTGLRNKYALNIDDGVSNREIEIDNNVVRGCRYGIYTFGSAEDEEGGTAEASGYYHHNDIHAYEYLVRSVNRSQPTKRLREFNYNTYRINLANLFDLGGGETGNFLYWKLHPAGSDVHDPNSITSTL